MGVDVHVHLCMGECMAMGQCLRAICCTQVLMLVTWCRCKHEVALLPYLLHAHGFHHVPHSLAYCMLCCGAASSTI